MRITVRLQPFHRQHPSCLMFYIINTIPKDIITQEMLENRLLQLEITPNLCIILRYLVVDFMNIRSINYLSAFSLGNLAIHLLKELLDQHLQLIAMELMRMGDITMLMMTEETMLCKDSGIMRTQLTM